MSGIFFPATTCSPKRSKLDRSSLIKPVIQNGQLCKFGELVSWCFHQGDNFYQILYTFLMILQPSDAQNSSFLHFFWSFKKYTQKLMPNYATDSVRKGFRLFDIIFVYLQYISFCFYCLSWLICCQTCFLCILSWVICKLVCHRGCEPCAHAVIHLWVYSKVTYFQWFCQVLELKKIVIVTFLDLLNPSDPAALV